MLRVFHHVRDATRDNLRTLTKRTKQPSPGKSTDRTLGRVYFIGTEDTVTWVTDPYRWGPPGLVSAVTDTRSAAKFSPAVGMDGCLAAHTNIVLAVRNA